MLILRVDTGTVKQVGTTYLVPSASAPYNHDEQASGACTGKGEQQ